MNTVKVGRHRGGDERTRVAETEKNKKKANSLGKPITQYCSFLYLEYLRILNCETEYYSNFFKTRREVS